MTEIFRRLQDHRVKLLPGLFKKRFDINRRYVFSLQTHNLLQNHYMEAGLWAPIGKPEDAHWGWESPTCQIRGEFLGHWLSAAAHIYASTRDQEIKVKADIIVSEVARCQQENGGEWAGPIPEKYFEWLARGKKVWAPHCTVHRNMMGLFDMYAWAGNQQALDILVRWARWFSRWSSQFTREQFDDMLDVETGGMLEVWSDLYSVTGDKEHYDLINRYDRPRLFNLLLAGKDPLTNMHANTTIPEILGAARAWEVTGENRWRDIVEAYWRCAVVDRGYYCTGGQTNGEFWTPPRQLSTRLGDKTQEHCTVYHMMRLAEYLLRWTGDASYDDYWERNLYNGSLAQQHPETGMVTYFLPLRSGSVKKWGTPTDDFWCCQGTLIQAHTIYPNHIFYEEGKDLVLSQYIPCQLDWNKNGKSLSLLLSEDTHPEAHRRPGSRSYELKITSSEAQEFALKFRLPGWMSASPEVIINGEIQAIIGNPSTYALIHKAWQNDTIHITLPQSLTTSSLPDLPDTVAFMEGPVVLAAVLGDESNGTSAETLTEKTLYGKKEDPTSLLIPDNEREFTRWRSGYRTHGQAQNIRFISLYEIQNECYAVYFPIHE
ncbi:MAG TPA: beta-L-arabinofuranosidase domain-containing protein [Anaerolineales bacterium]